MGRSLRSAGLGTNAFGVFLWHCARLLTQFTWVVILARSLDAEGYGLFSGLAALGLGLSGIAGLGLGLRMYQDVAREPALFPYRWSQTWQGLVRSSLLLAIIYFVVSAWQFTDASWSVVVAIGVSEVVLAPIASQIAFAYASHGRTISAAAVPALLSLARVAAAVIFISSSEGLEVYALWHATATFAGIALLLVVFRRDFPEATHRARLEWTDVREGLGFSAVWSSSLAFTSLDKVATLKFGGADTAGHYTAAHRLMSVVTLPIDALVLAVMPRLFRLGRGVLANGRTLFLLVLVTTTYGVLGGSVLFFSASILPWILGNSFAPAIDAVQVMAFVVPLYCLRVLGCNILLGIGQKLWRVYSEFAALAVLCVIASFRLPDGGPEGAAQALLIAEALLALLVWTRALLTPALQAEAAR